MIQDCLKTILIHLLEGLKWFKTVLYHLNPSLCLVGWVKIVNPQQNGPRLTFSRSRLCHRSFKLRLSYCADVCTGRYNNSCYIVVNETLTWQQASSRCQAMGGHLATIDSQAENGVIHSLIASKFHTWHCMESLKMAIWNRLVTSTFSLVCYVHHHLVFLSLHLVDLT